jgi:hypothetical protein
MTIKREGGLTPFSTRAESEEALNHVGSLPADLLIILNANEMSALPPGAIASAVGRVQRPPPRPAVCRISPSAAQVPLLTALRVTPR